MKNQVYQGTPTSSRDVSLPSTVLPGDLILVGSEPACSLNGYQANSGGGTCYFTGTFTGTVIGSSTHSPFTGEALGPGAQLYASGTLDAATNVTTGLLITGTTTDTPFGHIDPSGPGVASGATNTAANIKIGD